MNNPSIEELQYSDSYEQVYELKHNQVKDFVLNHLAKGGKFVKWYMFYQILMVLAGLFCITSTVVLAIRGNLQPLYYLFGAIIFSFTFLILIHELLHALAFKLTGAPKVSIGGYLKKFIFYAEADRHVLNRNQFTLVALTPLTVIKLTTLAGIILSAGHPAVYFWIFIMSAHSLFCAGDIGMLDYYYQFRNSELFIFDMKEEKTSYFYRKKN